MNESKANSGASAKLDVVIPENRGRMVRKGYSTRDLEDMYLRSEEVELLGVDFQEE